MTCKSSSCFALKGVKGKSMKKTDQIWMQEKQFCNHFRQVEWFEPRKLQLFIILALANIAEGATEHATAHAPFLDGKNTASQDDASLIPYRSMGSFIGFVRPKQFKQCADRGVRLDIPHNRTKDSRRRFKMTECISAKYPSTMKHRKELEHLVEFISDELAIYPKEFFKRMNLTEIRFVVNLKRYEKDVYAIPDVSDINNRDSEKYLYLNPDMIANKSRDYWAASLHHELSHLMDYTIDGEYYLEYPEWVRKNGLGKKENAYISSGASLQNDKRFAFKEGYGNLEGPGKYFITNYAQAAIEEDRAETFCFCVLDYRDVLKKYRGTAVHEKVKMMRRRVKKFCPQMDHDWWCDAMQRTYERLQWKKENDPKSEKPYWNNNKGHATWYDPWEAHYADNRYRDSSISSEEGSQTACLRPNLSAPSGHPSANRPATLQEQPYRESEPLLPRERTGPTSDSCVCACILL